MVAPSKPPRENTRSAAARMVAVASRRNAACPTGIDIPGFIKKIGTGNLRGSALTIFEQNIFGGSCARVCPTEILCQAACVRTAEEERPVRIGALQRRATDWLMEHEKAPFK